MKKSRLYDGRLMGLEIFNQAFVSDSFDMNIIIFYVLDGTAVVEEGDTPVTLKSKEFTVINPCRHHTFRAEKHTLTAKFTFDAEELKKYYDISKMKFSCKCDGEKNKENYEKFRGILESCIAYYNKNITDQDVLFHLNSSYYHIIQMLIDHFMVSFEEGDSPEADDDEQRIHCMIQYLNENYKHQITLNDLAEKMHLSSGYVSKYIKRKIGKNFGEYITELRLDYAINELENTNKTIANIALDNGFPNIAAFNKAFKERYTTTPKKYQTEYIIQAQKGDAQKALQAEVERYMQENDNLLHIHDGNGPVCQESITVNKNMRTPAENEKKLLMNAGRMVSLMRKDIQEHILMMKEQLGFEYARLWDIYDDHLQLNLETQDGKYNFAQMDKAVDFLIANHIKPYFELGFKSILLAEAYLEHIRCEEREIKFDSLKAYRDFLEALLGHFVNRYGEKEISSWYFEQWWDPRLFAGALQGKYFEIFETAYQIIKEISPEIKVGGAYDRPFGNIDFEKVVCAWRKRSIQPDFISVYCYGTQEKSESNYKYVRASWEPDFVKVYLTEKKRIMEKYGMHIPMHVSEWNLTISNRNIMNDSCFKGAYIVKNMMHSFDDAAMVGYWYGTDLYAECNESPSILNGCCGLMSYHGICKPAFYAFDFLNQMGNYVLGKTEHILVTEDDYNNYSILCHNYKHPGLQYYKNSERHIEIETVEQMFEDSNQIKLHIRIEGVKNGQYSIKINSVNQNYGSVQDEWRRIGLYKGLGPKDIEYMKRISVPHLMFSECLVENEILETDVVLEPHEIQCIHIFRRLVRHVPHVSDTTSIK